MGTAGGPDSPGLKKSCLGRLEAQRAQEATRAAQESCVASARLCVLLWLLVCGGCFRFLLGGWCGLSAMAKGAPIGDDPASRRHDRYQKDDVLLSARRKTNHHPPTWYRHM